MHSYCFHIYKLYVYICIYFWGGRVLMTLLSQIQCARKLCVHFSASQAGVGIHLSDGHQVSLKGLSQPRAPALST